MPRTVDVRNWPRRAAFEFFRDYDNPFFNVCVQPDVTALLSHCRAEGGPSFSLASLYLSLRAANECEPFRYRLRGDEVIVEDRIHVGTTHLLPDRRLAFIYFDYSDRFTEFCESAARARRRAESQRGDEIDPQSDRTDLIHFSSLPWLAFTSFAHARKWGTGDSVPKIVFGKYSRGSDRVTMPVSVEVHHALMDGVHVGDFVERLESYFADPAPALGGPP